MRTLVLRICDYSLDGVVAVEDTEFFEFCRELPDDQEQLTRTRRAFERADVQSLIGLGLVDEYRLLMFPYVAGGGRTLFGDLGKPRSLALESAVPFGNGVVELVYRRSGD